MQTSYFFGFCIRLEAAGKELLEELALDGVVKRLVVLKEKEKKA